MPAIAAGGIWAEQAAWVDASSFTHNSAGGTGGGLHSNGGHSRVQNSTFSVNTVGNLEVDGDFGGGGAVHQSGGSLTLENVDFFDNQSQNHGGAVDARAALTVTGGVFFRNRASLSGGGLYQEGDSGALLPIQGAIFQDNVASSGGGIYANARLAITDTDFLSNTATTYGGGLFGNAASALMGGTFLGNRTTFSNTSIPLLGGGGIYMDSGSLTVHGTQFTANTSAQQGGALLMADNAPVTFILSDTTFTGNRALSGGAVEGAGEIIITDSRFHANQADFEGGAIRAFGQLTVTATSFLTNSAPARGGAIAALVPLRGRPLTTMVGMTGSPLTASRAAARTPAAAARRSRESASRG